MQKSKVHTLQFAYFGEWEHFEAQQVKSADVWSCTRFLTERVHVK